MVKDIYPDFNAYPEHLTSMGDLLFFEAGDGVHGRELWKSDGTENGTIMVGEINPIGNSGLDFLTVIDNTLFFQANDGTSGHELWKLENTTGINDPQDLFSEMIVFPNPASDRINLKITDEWTGSLNITILDMSGRTYGVGRYNKTEMNFQVEVNLGNLSAGLYQILVSRDGNLASRAFVVW